MFVRPCWQAQNEAEIYSFIDQYPWALLVSNGELGPFATNLPLLLERKVGRRGALVGHLARANPHVLAIQSEKSPALAVFQGPWSYVTASWYPERDMPPTYYYTAVHCYGKIRIQSDAELRDWVEILTRRMEQSFPDGWKTSEIPEKEITRRLPAILGFELEIERIEGKWKVGQDEPKKDAVAVAERLREGSGDGNRVLAEYIEHYNAQRADK